VARRRADERSGGVSAADVPDELLGRDVSAWAVQAGPEPAGWPLGAATWCLMEGHRRQSAALRAWRDEHDAALSFAELAVERRRRWPVVEPVA
jgi:hypothetical protein